jgi:hypothetical protein
MMAARWTHDHVKARLCYGSGKIGAVTLIGAIGALFLLLVCALM